MKISLLAITSVVVVLWIIHTIWAAPTWEENEDGSWTCVDEGNSLKDLFKRKK